jgi:two-component system sensor histidine kinase BaeS
MTQRIDPRPVRLELRAFLAELVDRHKETVAAKHLTVTVEPAEGSACLDPAIIGRVLDNQLTNAIRHTPEGGSVTLAAESSPGLLTLTVEDTGPGVPPCR